MRNVNVTFVIMAGGRGERLWPFVRATQPKVCLAPDGKHTLLQATIERLRPVWPSAEWLIVTTHLQAPAVRASLPAALRRAVLVEPQIKNTAACMTLAAAVVAAREPDRVLVLVPADHWIQNAQAFRQAMRTAIRAAAIRHQLVMIGMRPTHAHTGFGYLCAGPAVRGSWPGRVRAMDRFIEKPSAGVARYL